MYTIKQIKRLGLVLFTDARCVTQKRFNLMLYDLYKKSSTGTLFKPTDVRKKTLLEILTVLVKHCPDQREYIIKNRAVVLPNGVEYQIRASLSIAHRREE